ncbi:MAG: hypothetical protein ACREUY_03340, partial [Burkholderiales bacterium]
MSDYSNFLQSKTQGGAETGFAPLWMPDSLFDFQAAKTEWAIRKGRAANVADCGMGKTLMGLVWASNVARKTGKPVLYLTPVAVGPQTIREAHKFGIEASLSRDGSSKGHIIVANYERLHYFDSNDFGGVVCDECFAAGTEIDTPDGKVRIEDIREGMYITNAAGTDVVSDVHRREVPYAVRVTTATTSFIASPNHPIFTQRGWVGAQHLRPGDYALETSAAVPMVRGEFCAEISGSAGAAVLRDILLSEMAHDTAGDIGESSL